MNIRSSLIAVALLAGVSSQALAAQTLKFHQEPAELTTIDLGAKGQSNGDMVVFEAALRGADGLTATLDGLLITVHRGAVGKEVVEDRAGELYIDFGKGDSLVIAGKSLYAEGSKEMKAEAPQLRAIIGGTGRYIGAHGQMTTVRHGDGSYDHVIDLLD